MPTEKPKHTCPICGKSSDFNAPPVGFFCSDRCKMIDLGKWLGEDYRISEPLRPDHFEEFEEHLDGVRPDNNTDAEVRLAGPTD